MILLPVGHSEDSVRRLPWVTFAIMGLCILSLIMAHEATWGTQDDLQDELLEALEYYATHPYLEVDEDFQRMVFQGVSEREQELMMEALAGDAWQPESSEDLAAEQARLDELIERALSGVYDHPYFKFGLIPNDISLFAILTHMFMHAGFMHLFGNLLILYLAGPFIEDVWGRGVFIGFYLLSGLAAAFTYIAFNPSSEIPMVGASGAIAGVMGAFLVRYWRTKIRFFYMFGFFFRGVFDAPAWFMLPLWFGQQLFFAMAFTQMTEDMGGGVAYWAHVGGFVFGVAAAGAIRKFGFDARFEQQIGDKLEQTLVDNPEVDRALELNAVGNADEAMRILAEKTAHDPRNHDAALAYWGLACEHKREPEAAQAMLRVIRDDMRKGQPEMVLSHWAELTGRIPGVQADPDLLIRIAQLYGQNSQWDQSAATLRRALLAGGSSMNAGVALRLARAALKVDPAVASGAARLAQARSDIEPAEQQLAAEILRQAAEMGPGAARPRTLST